jgi:GT2 family glycosyltransferase
MTEPPTVALVVPTRNESRDISACLAALSSQTYARHRLQILVVDGESSDDTRDLVRRLMRKDDRIRLFSNPDRAMAPALNIGIAASDAEVIGAISGHSVVESDYVERAVAALERTGAWCVGGRISRESSTVVQRAIARATSSPIGVGDSRHNFATDAGWAETAFPGIWPRWVFERVGVFDVAMPYNEDNELSSRILAAGGRIWYEPSIVVRYVPRGTLSGVFAQYRRYGRGKVRVFRKHPAAVRWRHLVPPAWVGWLIATGLAGLAVPSMRLAGGVSVVAYGGLMFAGAMRSRRSGDPIALTMAAFGAIHAGYGIGIWQGLFDLLRRQ